MTKIELTYSAKVKPFGYQDVDERILKEFASARAGSLDFFRKSGITRDSILVTLELYNVWDYAPEMTKSPLFDALKQLTGFKTVTLRFAIMGTWNYRHEKYERRIELFQLEVLESTSKAVCEYLEPTLGNSSVMRKLSKKEIGDDAVWLWKNPDISEIVFHPRDHQAALSKAKNDN